MVVREANGAEGALLETMRNNVVRGRRRKAQGGRMNSKLIIFTLSKEILPQFLT